MKSTLWLTALGLLLAACGRDPARLGDPAARPAPSAVGAAAAHGICYVHLKRLRRDAAKDPAASLALFNHYGGAGRDPAKQQAILRKARAAGHPWAVTLEQAPSKDGKRP